MTNKANGKTMEFRRNNVGEIEEFFPCSCRSKDHFLTVDTLKDMENIDTEEVSVSVIVQGSNFPWRLGQIWDILRGKKQATVEEVLFDKNNIDKLDHLIHVLQTARDELKDQK